jgi:hypothetical protein
MPDDQIAQILLKLKFRELARHPDDQPQFSDVEFRCHSQNGEDGILLYLFSLLGTVNRRAVEICAGDGYECNAANLIINHGWRGLLVDGDPENVARGRQFYATCRDTCISPPTLIQAWVTAENVNPIVAEHGFAGPIDLLSLDLDGNDYWIWKALDTVMPQVVVLEFNAALGPSASLTIPYQPDFKLDFSVRPYKCGAGLAAFVALGRAKGYRLVGVQSLGFNAFFVRNGVGEAVLPERTAVECFQTNDRLRAWHDSQLEAMLTGDQAWVEV